MDGMTSVSIPPRRPVRKLVTGIIWGDEGKGKIVDDYVCLAQSFEDGRDTVVARFQGGENAGHTLYVFINGKWERFVTHAAPSGIIRNTDIAIGPGVAFNPLSLIEEIKKADRLIGGYNGRILISNRVGICFDYHKMIDSARESAGKGVGSTRSGIAPFYEDVARKTTRVTFQEYLSDKFPDKLRQVLEDKKVELEAIGINHSGMLEMLVEKHKSARQGLRGHGVDLEYRMAEYMKRGAHIIIEGAQGSGLDVDMGDIPNTTSSHLLAPNAFPSLGLKRKDFDIIGVEKIYVTRVGDGDFPTYTTDSFAEIGDLNGEFGASTGRKRRVGYPDWVMARRNAWLNDCDGIVLTRADCVQDREMKVCVAYEVDGKVRTEVPVSLTGVKPVYSGTSYKWKLWEGHRNLADPLNEPPELTAIRSDYVKNGFDGLPGATKEFVRDHDRFVGCKTIGISVGARSGETIYI